MIHVVGLDTRGLERVDECIVRKRDVRVLTEALFPLVGVRLTGQAPAIEELETCRPPSEGARLRTVGTRHERDCAVAPVTLVGAAG